MTKGKHLIVNYYNYFTEIEDTFVRRRGKNLLLGPIDWAMIETWQERGIPLHVVLRAIERVFDNFDKHPRSRSIKSLVFCREEVEAQFAEWSAARVGASSTIDEATVPSQIPLEDIRRHIVEVSQALLNVEASNLCEDLERARTRLTELADQLSEDLEMVDRSLLDIENFIDDALLLRSEKTVLNSAERAVSEQLREYRSSMDKEAYAQTHRLMLLKRLREDAGIPRLGLFYL